MVNSWGQNKPSMEGPREKVEEKSRPSDFAGFEHPVHFREIQSADMDEIMTIERASFASPWSAHFFLEEIRVSCAKFVLAEVEGRVVGYIIYWRLPKEVDIHNLAVHSAYRRQGIGRSLLSSAIDSAKGQGSNRVTLEVRKSNQAAQQLYHSLGFVERGVRKGYYSDDGEDALVMVLDMDG